jgi:cytochrome c peroxidase
LGTGDDLWLSVGTGAEGLGLDRASDDDPAFVPRHALDLFNRGDPSWQTLFWDGRVEERDGRLSTPLGPDLPAGLDGVLAAQALFPLLDRAEMLGQPGDTAADGAPNELADHADAAAIFAGILARLEAIDAYDPLFEAAWPDLDPADRGIHHVANALAAYQATAFAFTDTPYDRYLTGDDDALDDSQKLGALVFFGDGQCVACHGGPLLTDQLMHVTGVPQLGPGLPAHAPLDPGRSAVSDDDGDRFAFRTPPLRNVALTAPYMHNGAYADLEAAVLHYGSPEDAARTYDASLLHPALQPTVQRDEAHLSDLEGRLSPELPTGDATTVGLSNVRAFLEGLTDPAAADLSALVPASVPSGLPVGGAR